MVKGDEGVNSWSGKVHGLSNRRFKVSEVRNGAFGREIEDMLIMGKSLDLKNITTTNSENMVKIPLRVAMPKDGDYALHLHCAVNDFLKRIGGGKAHEIIDEKSQVVGFSVPKDSIPKFEQELFGYKQQDIPNIPKTPKIAPRLGKKGAASFKLARMDLTSELNLEGAFDFSNGYVLIPLNGEYDHKNNMQKNFLDDIKKSIESIVGKDVTEIFDDDCKVLGFAVSKADFKKLGETLDLIAEGQSNLRGR